MVFDQSREDVKTLMRPILNAKETSRIAEWNVRTMFQSGKIDQLLREFDKYRLEVLGISEMRWPGSGKVEKEGKTVLFSGGEKHYRGVGLVLSLRAAGSIMNWKPISDRIITVRLQTKFFKTTIVQAYAPIEDAEEEDKDKFYEELQKTFDEIPNHDLRILMGDFNAQICQDREGVEQVIGPFGKGASTTDNGERLIAFCGLNCMSVCNTFFQHKAIHKKTWRSPGGDVTNEIDFICVSRRWHSSVQDVRVCRGADVGSDHHLLVAKIHIKLKKMQRKERVKPFAVDKLMQKDEADAFRTKFEEELRKAKEEEKQSIEGRWQSLQQSIVRSAEETIGRKRGTRKEQWIKAQTWEKIDERKRAKIKREEAKDDQVRKKAIKEYREVDKEVKRMCKADKKDWLDSKGKEAEEAAKKGDARTLFRIAKDLGGRSFNSSVPVKSKDGKPLLTQEGQKQRWKEHFEEILNQDAPVREFDFSQEVKVGELEVEEGEIRQIEIKMAIKKLKNRKAAGVDQIVGEFLKHGGPEMEEEIRNVVNMCWETGEVPEDWQRGVIVKLPKSGDMGDCNNWRGITLLSVVGKVYCIVLLNRIKGGLDELMREEQAGFREGRGCTEQIMTLRVIVEQCLECQQGISINFVDFKKAFDSVHRESLWQILGLYGVPDKFIRAFKGLYKHSECCVRTEDGGTEFFTIETGVRQGCILSPLLFLVALDFVLRKVTEGYSCGVPWSAGRKVCDLDFADDLAMIGASQEELQGLTDRLVEYAGRIGLRMSVKKTKIMHIGGHDGVIKTEGEEIATVSRFTYLGSLIRNDGEVWDDVKTRCGKGMDIFGKMRSVWEARSIALKTKIRLYKAIVVPTVLYASETWRTTKRVEAKLDAFHHRCLRKILGVTWRDRVTNEEIKKRTGQGRLQDVVAGRRLQFWGHVRRMGESRIPKEALQWKPAEGRRKRGRPRQTWRRTVEKDFADAGLSVKEAFDDALDREKWRKLVARCVQGHGRI